MFGKWIKLRAIGVIIFSPRRLGNSIDSGGTVPDVTWQALYRTALAESDPVKINGRIEAAKQAIHTRLQQLDESGDSRERQQLNDALGALLTLAARKRCA